MGTAKYSRRNKFASWRPYRCWCAAWLILCQFPVPIAHSHDGLAHQNPLAWQAHLQSYHPETCPDFSSGLDACANHSLDGNDIHWHWVFPADLAVNDWGSPATDRALPFASPFGLWDSASGSVAGQFASAAMVLCEADSVLSTLRECYVEPAPFLETISSSLICETQLAPHPTLGTSFTQSYLGVLLRDLIGVCLV